MLASVSEPLPQQPLGNEIHNDVVNETRRLMERFNNRPTLDNLRLTERYFESEMHVLVHFRWRNNGEYVATFQREFSNDGLGEIQPRVTGGIGLGDVQPKESFLHDRPLAWKHSVQSVLSRASKKHFVLIDNVKAVDAPEDFTRSSTVWLDSIDGLYGLIPYALYLSPTSGFVLRGIDRNRKVHTGKRGEPSHRIAHEIVAHVLEGAAEVMNSIPGNERNGFWHIPDADELVNAVSSLRIILESEGIGVFFAQEVSPCGFEITDVLVGPI